MEPQQFLKVQGRAMYSILCITLSITYICKFYIKHCSKTHYLARGVVTRTVHIHVCY